MPNYDITSRSALIVARDLILTYAPDHGGLTQEVAAQLTRILDQRGCEVHDTAVTDGRLTTLMDIIIDG